MAIGEAIEHLGLLRSERASDLARFMQLLGPISAQEMAASYLKDGEQISEMEKRFLGVSASAHMSRPAFEDLNHEGLASPKTAHFLTFARALASVQRFAEIEKCLKGGTSQLTCSAERSSTCRVCIQWAGVSLDVSQVSPFGPSDCPNKICELRFISRGLTEKRSIPWRWRNIVRLLSRTKEEKTRDDKSISR